MGMIEINIAKKKKEGKNMTEKEISEIRRRFTPDKTGVTRVRGCYVSEKKEIVSEFNQSFLSMTQGESEEMLTVLKKTLSGTPGKNLIDIEFSANQVLSGEQQKTLLALRNSELADDEAAHALYERIREHTNIDGNYIIFLVCDKYDAFTYSADDTKDFDSSYTFTYILCSVCPVKLTKPALSYYSHENKFHSVMANSVVCMPELGFMYPTFDDRSSNIYGTLLYTKSTLDSREDFVDSVFGCTVPLPAGRQKEAFETLLGETAAEDCKFEVVQAVHEELCGMIAEHKETKAPEPLLLSGEQVKTMLASCGVKEEKLAAFEEKYAEEFGKDAQVLPQNLVDVKQFEVRTPDIVIKVNPERTDLIKTEIIDGKKYILIRAEDNVEVNGVAIRI